MINETKTVTVTHQTAVLQLNYKKINQIISLNIIILDNYNVILEMS